MKHTFKNTINHDIPESTRSEIRAYNQQYDKLLNGKKSGSISFSLPELFFGVLRIDTISIDDETGITEMILKHKDENGHVYINFFFSDALMLELLSLLSGIENFNSLKSEVKEHSFEVGKDFNYYSWSTYLFQYLDCDPDIKRFLSLLGINPASMDKLRLIDEEIINKSTAILGKYIINKAELLVQEKIKLLTTGSSTNEASLAASSSSSSSSSSSTPEVGKELEGSSVVSSLTMFSSKDKPENEILDHEEEQDLNRLLRTGI